VLRPVVGSMGALISRTFLYPYLRRYLGGISEHIALYQEVIQDPLSVCVHKVLLHCQFTCQLAITATK